MRKSQGIKEKSTDPLGDPKILKMQANLDMNEELEDYDLIIVHYYNSDIQGTAEVQSHKESYRNAIAAFREELPKRVEAGIEGFRRVRFAECDFSSESNFKFLLMPDRITYPNVLMYLSGAPYPFNPFEQDFKTPEQLTNFLFDTFMKKTNFFVKRLSCEEFKKKRAANEQMTIYVGPYKNLVGLNAPMYELNRLDLFDKRSFSTTSLNLFIFDIHDDRNTKGCWGKDGMPAKDLAKEGLYYFYHSEAEPINLGEEDNPKFFHHMDHLEIMRTQCRIDLDIKMLWSKCTFFLMD